MFVLMIRRSGVRALQRLHARVVARERDDRLDPVLAQRAFDLPLGIRRIERRDDRPDLPRAELGDDELRAVRQQQRDPVAALDPERRERRGAGVAELLQLTPGERRALEEQRGAIGPLAREIAQIVDQRAARVRRQRALARRRRSGRAMVRPGVQQSQRQVLMVYAFAFERAT